MCVKQSMYKHYSSILCIVAHLYLFYIQQDSAFYLIQIFFYSNSCVVKRNANMSIKSGHARWAFDLEAWKHRCTINDLKLATSCIQPEEKERLAKFVYRDDFNASIIGRLLMRRFIAACLPELDYNAIRFERDSRGKPFLNRKDYQISHIDFNVSHHDRYTVLAGTYASNPSATDEQTIGVDVMKTEYSGGKPLSEFFRIMQRTFTVSEWNFIKSRETEQKQTNAFMRHWCLKESYVKNVGVGITINLQNIDFQLNSESLPTNSIVRDSVVSVDQKQLNNWVFEESLLGDDHCIAVAVKNPSPKYLGTSQNEFLFEMIDFEKLMHGAVPLLSDDSEYCRKILEKELKRTTV